jgi:hypothetical protein
VPHSRILPVELQLPSLVLLCTFLAWVVRLIRAQRLNLRESLPWLLSTLAAIAVTARPELLVWTADLLHVQVPSNAFFAIGILYLAVNVLSVTIIASGNAQRVRRLAQECAVLRAEIEALRAEHARAAQGRARDATP